MSALLRLRPLPETAKSVTATTTAPAGMTPSGRLVAVGVALLLLPALAMVAVASGVGVLVLAAWRHVVEVDGGRGPHDGSPVGLEAIRS